MFESILIIILILVIPRLMVLLSDKSKFFGTLGPVFLCYAYCVAIHSCKSEFSEVQLSCPLSTVH